MRAVCEQCSAVQPAGWTAGDLCTSCGLTVRHEVRCFWCANWTPAAAFCRTCGADVVEERLYGAARMLKDAGTDRFTVPEQLYSLGVDRIDNFTRIYQRHAVTAARHVDDRHAVEQHLHDRHWSAGLDDELAGQLPWPLDRLTELSQQRVGGPVPGDGAAFVRAVHDDSPFPRTRQLAALALVQLGDWSALDEARALLHDAEAPLRLEAALVLTSWRVRTVHGVVEDPGALTAALETVPAASRAAAQVRLAALRGTPDSLPPDDALAHDPDSLFDAALQRVDVDRLTAALGDDSVACVAAARALVSAGVIAPLDRPLRSSPDDVRDEILQALVRSKRPCDEVHDSLVELAVSTAGGQLRRRAAQVACRSMTHQSAMRIARNIGSDPFDGAAIMQSLLQCERVDSETVVALADLMLETGTFTLQQYGLSTVAEDGRLPDTFVPSRFDAADEPTRRELLGVAERQLGRCADPALHSFALRVLFGEHPAETRSAAMWVLRRWYREQGDIRGEGPFVLHVGAVEEHFGTIERFVSGLCSVLADDATMREVGIYEYIANLLGTADDEFVAALQTGRVGQRLVDTLVVAVQHDYWPNTLEAMFTLLSRLGERPDWCGAALAALLRLDRAGNYHYDRAIERLQAVAARS